MLQIFTPKLFILFTEYFLKKRYSQVYGKSTTQVFDEIGLSKCKKLTFLLNVTPGGGLGVTSDELPFILHASFLMHFHEKGSMYPEGGPKSLVTSILATIMARGGKLLTRGRVEKILVENGKTKGVEMCDNTVILCNNIISTIGVPSTQYLLPEGEKSKLDSVYTEKDGFNLFSMFYGIDLKGLPQDQRPPNGNIWIAPELDYNKTTFEEYTKEYAASKDLN